MPNLVASGLFGDGASAVVGRRGGVPPARRRARTCSTRAAGSTPTPSAPWASTSAAPGLRIVLDAAVPEVIGRYVREDVDGFLADHGLTVDDIGWWVCHPGGPKVIEALQADARASPARPSS